MKYSAANRLANPLQMASTLAAPRDDGWALRLGQGKDCDCASWSLPVPRTKPVLAPRAPGPRRRAIWDLGDSLHCSVIGTCLTTDELRRLLRKLDRGEADASDHRLHGMAVGLCGRNGVPAKLINKALDDRHRSAIRRFDTAQDEAALRQLWTEALAAGDIPGAYWAVLTHPLADKALLTDVFGDVHMLSHLVGAANRADIRRLAEQDREIAALRATVARQQDRLREDLTARDARIRALQEMLAAEATRAVETLPEAGEADRLIAALRARADRLAARAEAAEARAATAERRRIEESRRAETLLAEAAALRGELAAAEDMFDTPRAEEAAPGEPRLVLYVGGRSGQTAVLHKAAARAGAELLHHDAEQGSSLLPGLVGRAALVVFPVDCVNHDAALMVKRLCQQQDRPYRPLRSTGAASLIAALRDAATPDLH